MTILTQRAALPADRNATDLSCLLESMASALNAVSHFRPEEDFIRYALDSSAIVAVTDVQGTITYVNGKFCEISGYTPAELIGSNHRMLRSGLHDTDFFRALYRTIAKGGVWHGEICNRRKDGSLYWVDTTVVPHLNPQGKVDSYTSIRFDITARKQLEVDLRASKQRLKRLADLDPLTGLPNRRRFQAHLEMLIAGFAATGEEFHLAMLDLDTFKEINDSFGHHAGDELLRTVAARLGALGEHAFISRLGGDEFGIVLTDTPPTAAAGFFEAVLNDIRQPISLGATTRRCSASLGIARFPRDGDDAESLLKAADLALYQAKSLGRDRCELFHPALRDAAEQRSELLRDIENGLRLDMFELHYQHIVPARGDGPVSLEALMRWRHPQRGLLAPGDFDYGFSDPGIRAALGLFMLERAFKDVAAFAGQGMALCRVAVNLTNSDFRSDVFVDRFLELCAETGLEPQRFCVEVTEGMFLGLNQKRVHDGLRRLHDAGVEIALDDFGTGYASLTHLRHLPIDRLKIDRSFVANMAASREDRAIIRGVVDIAHNLGKRVTVEGVETAEHLALLSQMDCDHFQGWFFSKAVAPARLAQTLRAMRRVRA